MEQKREVRTAPGNGEERRVQITYFTDPLCCWSWGMRATLEKLKCNFPNVAFRYRMAGLIPDWRNYTDSANSVSRPLQMGPVWMYASHMTGVPINYNIWFTDPPASSYPACIAFKAMQLQSDEYAIRYLDLMWEDCMVKGINIAKQSALLEIADLLSAEFSGFHHPTFEKALVSARAREAFQEDLNAVKLIGITRFPTLIFKYQGQSLMSTGFRPYEKLVETMEQVISTEKV